METRSRSPLRLLAPVAIIVFALALVVVLSSATEEEENTSNREVSAAKQRDLGRSTSERRRPRRREGRLPQGTYIVKTGDTLAGIAQKTGVPIEKIRELNPELDPQALVSGQRIKLRE
jgi:hypothetical protein